ncbi:ephrin-B2-like isoform X3 [Orbicella faveolata]|uniref:ephrin-B2-like isoform X3 n=1 Tax=Orbicella faveolata TaxID=48498 RepID=UPI0009E2E1E6|nr:ephrin-B2-like isoform X3 [Orbicella faveolata]
MALASMHCRGVTVVFCFCLLVSGSVAEILPSILWHPENQLFKNLGDTTRKVMAFDKLSIICPNLVQYPIIRDTSFSKDLLYQNVYMVDENGYNNCNATGGLSILSCDDPSKYSHATIVFQPSTADINDPKFKQGKAYYFINTASGLLSSLTNTQGGYCNQGMKLKMYVCNGSSDPNCPEGNKVFHGGWCDWSECLDGHQTRHCNSPTPANGGLPCIGPDRRLCTVKSSQTLPCSTTNSETATEPGLPSKDGRTGDKLSDNELRINKGVFVAICLIILLVGIAVGGVLCLLVYRKQRRNHKRKVKITRVPSALSSTNSRPNSTVSTLSTVSENAPIVPPHS